MKFIKIDGVSYNANVVFSLGRDEFMKSTQYNHLNQEEKQKALNLVFDIIETQVNADALRNTSQD